ncbi:hypothetical protein LX36DRAFT_449406 [Colletotrichum falcatum]|nr:hypothetical protein LX36DRAFT_449406 [Colletotrichum falcatum]
MLVLESIKVVMCLSSFSMMVLPAQLREKHIKKGCRSHLASVNMRWLELHVIRRTLHQSKTGTLAPGCAAVSISACLQPRMHNQQPNSKHTNQQEHALLFIHTCHNISHFIDYLCYTITFM